MTEFQVPAPLRLAIALHRWQPWVYYCASTLDAAIAETRYHMADYGLGSQWFRHPAKSPVPREMGAMSAIATDVLGRAAIRHWKMRLSWPVLWMTAPRTSRLRCICLKSVAATAWTRLFPHHVKRSNCSVRLRRMCWKTGMTGWTTFRRRLP
ncbi:RES domain-containing protein [Litchfieldella qijiaojingensis]|uniref:RES domain-containing protein n=1 Tax=Litchfieldella qijiaojingensis TaxID=980347 RepID=UPI001675EC56